jgi:Exostosin family
MNVYFWTEGESIYARDRLDALTASWKSSPGEFKRVDQAEEANVIIAMFTEPAKSYSFARKLLTRNCTVSARANDLFVWDTMDMPMGLWPGFYASLRKSRVDRTRHRTFCYLGSLNQFLELRPPKGDGSEDIFFSFQGSLSSRPRAQLFDTKFDRKDIFIEKVAPIWGSQIFGTQFDDMKKRYVDMIARSKFVLCPRGNGTSSFRLFEVMQCGRVPVIIADSWVPPEGVDWKSCSVRVQELDIPRIPSILEEYESSWAEMASCARRVWEDHYCPSQIGESLLNGIKSIRKSRRFPERWYRVGWPVRSSTDAFRRYAVSTKIVFQKSLRKIKANTG